MNEVVVIVSIALLALAVGGLLTRSYYKGKEHERRLLEIIHTYGFVAVNDTGGRSSV